MLVFLLEFPLFFLLIGKGKINLLISFAVYLILCGAILLARKGKPKIDWRIRYPFLSILISLACSARFFFRWNHTGYMIRLAGFLNIPYKQACLIIASLFGLAALSGADYLIKVIVTMFVKNRSGGSETAVYKGINRGTVFLYLLLTAFLMISLNSQSSPLYPFNTWDDANTIFTVGKSILKGAVPYRDLYEQKGPLLLFLQVPAALISFKDFLGLWIIEIISAFCFLLLVYKTLRLFMGKKTLVLIPLIAFSIYTSTAFHPGGSAEEYCLPLIMYAVYTGVKALKNRELPSNREFFLVGITSGCVFWMKYSMVGFYAGWFLFFLLVSIRDKRVSKLFQGTLRIAAGVFLVTLPILLYFVSVSAVDSLFECYFYNNLVLYPDDRIPFLEKLTEGINNKFDYSSGILVLFIIGLLWLDYLHERRIFLLLITTYCGTFLSVYSGGHFYGYYSLIDSVYICFGFLAVMDIIRRQKTIPVKFSLDRPAFIGVTFFLSLLLVSIFAKNMFLLRHEKEDLMQYKMKAILEEKGITDPVILTTPRGDSGIYTVMGVVPRIRFFCRYNNDKNEVINNAQDEYIAERIPDVLIRYNSRWNIYPDYPGYTYMGYVEGLQNYKYGYFHYYLREE